MIIMPMMIKRSDDNHDDDENHVNDDNDHNDDENDRHCRGERFELSPIAAAVAGARSEIGSKVGSSENETIILLLSYYLIIILLLSY